MPALRTACKRGHPLTPENRVPSGKGGTTCRICTQARQRAWREAHADAERARTAARLKVWQKENREKTHAYNRKCYLAHREPRLEAARAKRRSPQGGAIREWYRNYVKTPAAKAWQRNNQQARRTRKLQNGVGEPLPLRKFYLWVQVAEAIPCAYCSADTPPGARHVDHATPLARGGAHAVGNLRVACPPCNWRKQTQTEAEFMGGR